MVTNPLGAVGGAFENAVVDALRPSRGRRRSNRDTPRAGQSAMAREGRYLNALDEQDVLDAALELHRLPVAPASPPKAPAPLAVDVKKARKAVRRNVRPPLFSPRERWRRLRAADELAAEEVVQERGRRAALAADQQRRLDAAYVSLMANEPEAVRAAAGSALAAMPLDAAVFEVVESRLDICVVYPLVDDLIPREAPVITPTGRPSARKRTQTERNELYAEAISSAALSTLKVAAAAAPGIERIRLLVVVSQGGGEPILVADVTREGLLIGDSTARGSLGLAGDLLMTFKGRTRTVAVLARQGLVDELLSSVERAAGEPRRANPFDLEVFAAEQEEHAARFATRLQTLLLKPPSREPVPANGTGDPPRTSESLDARTGGVLTRPHPPAPSPPMVEPKRGATSGANGWMARPFSKRHSAIALAAILIGFVVIGANVTHPTVQAVGGFVFFGGVFYGLFLLLRLVIRVANKLRGK